jgi:hypothetical protein
MTGDYFTGAGYSIGLCPVSGKKRYITKKNAKKVVKIMRNNKGLHAYRCDDCGDWHIGHHSIAVMKGRARRP